MVKNEKMKKKYEVDALHIKKKHYIQRNQHFQTVEMQFPGKYEQSHITSLETRKQLTLI